MANLRNLALTILRLTGRTTIATAIRHHSRNPQTPTPNDHETSLLASKNAGALQQTSGPAEQVPTLVISVTLCPVAATNLGGLDDDAAASVPVPLPRSLHRFHSSQARHAAGVLGIILKEAGALDCTEEEIAAAVELCRTVADLDPHGAGVSARKLFERLEGRYPRAVLERRLAALMTAGSVEKDKEILNEQDVRLSLSGSLSLILVPWISTMSGQRALLEMFSRVQARASSPDAPAEDVRSDLAELRRVLSTFANELRRTVDSRKTAAMLEHAQGADDRVLRTRITQLKDAVVRRFTDELTDDLERLTEAGDRYVVQQLRLLKLLSKSRGVLGHWVQRDEVHEVARTASPGRLAALWDGIAFDEAAVWVNPTRVLEAADDLTFPRGQDPIPEPAEAGPAIEDAPPLRDTLRALADRLLDGAEECDLTQTLLFGLWPEPAVLLAQLSILEGLDIGYALHHPGTLVVRADTTTTRLVSGLVLRRVPAGSFSGPSEALS
ncbi:hypothetical protein [Frankia gtarii]|uniref:hypothetical protein n=1 Tax=Frankia gtarii TaxID=2950102 RepID=UPI0021BED5C9|nr:hypothetical protein [Frankia gtarii]